MARARKPASTKKGKSETKAQLKRREEMEQKLMGNTDDIQNIPADLKTDAEKMYYGWLIKEIEISGIITNLDIPLLKQTATVLWMIDEATESIRENGQLLESYDRFGNLVWKPNPSVKILQDCQTKYNNFCNQLGLSPASRASLAGKKAEQQAEAEDELLKILRED